MDQRRDATVGGVSDTSNMRSISAAAVGLMPDLPGYVHGIKSTSPWVVQCDGCGATRTGATASAAVLGVDRIEFNPSVPDKRMCHDCWREAGWEDGYIGWRQIA